MFDDSNLEIPDFLKRQAPSKRKKQKATEKVEYVSPERVIKTPGWGKKVKTILVDDKPKVKAYRPSIQEAIREKHSNIIGDIEGMIDDGEIGDFYKYLGKIKATPMGCKAIIEKYVPVRDELQLVIDSPEDEDLQEGYMNYSWEEITELVKMYQVIIDESARYAVVNKTVRKAAKKKPIKKEKLLKTFKFLEKDDNFKVASIDPGIIIGAQELWSFNVISKALTVHRALDRAGLSIKGSAVTGWDEKTSVTKVAGRKSDEVLKSVVSGGKIILRKLMDQIKTKPGKTVGRIGKHTILLKAVL